MPSTQSRAGMADAEDLGLDPQVKELILQSLAHEEGGVEVYETALECAIDDDLSEEWTKYLAQTREHVEALSEICEALGLDPDERTPGCRVVQHLGKGLVEAMEMALAAGDENAAQLVACECVVLAETKDHLDWELLSEVANAAEPELKKILAPAVKKIEDEEDEHLYHTKGWCRELWLDALGLDAKLPPPEETRDVKTAKGAARVAETRKKAGKKR